MTGGAPMTRHAAGLLSRAFLSNFSWNAANAALSTSIDILLEIATSARPLKKGRRPAQKGKQDGATPKRITAMMRPTKKTRSSAIHTSITPANLAKKMGNLARKTGGISHHQRSRRAVASKLNFAIRRAPAPPVNWLIHARGDP
jgi:hypothetical protein